MIKKIRSIARKCLADFRSRGLWRACAAEFIGTFLLVVFCAAPGVSFLSSDGRLQSVDAQIVRGALASGLIVTCLVWSFGHISGAHVNPAVSIAFTITGKVTAARAIMYLPAQCAGSIAGGMALKYLTPLQLHNSSEFGVNSFNPSLVHPAQALASEFLLTFAMLTTIMAATDSRRFDLRGSIPIVIGLQVAACILAGAPFSGASMNPARTLGPAVAAARFDQLWIYIAGPISGAAAGSVTYEMLFRGKYMQIPDKIDSQDEFHAVAGDGEASDEAAARRARAETIFTTSF